MEDSRRSRSPAPPCPVAHQQSPQKTACHKDLVEHLLHRPPNLVSALKSMVSDDCCDPNDGLASMLHCFLIEDFVATTEKFSCRPTCALKGGSWSGSSKHLTSTKQTPRVSGAKFSTESSASSPKCPVRESRLSWRMAATGKVQGERETS